MLSHGYKKSSDQTFYARYYTDTKSQIFGQNKKKSASSRHQMTLPLVSPYYCSISSSPAFFFVPALFFVGGKKAH